MKPIYRFGDAVIDEDEIAIDEHAISLPGFERPVNLALENKYQDMV